MRKYRIKTETNTVTKEKRYVVQYKSLFSWYDCETNFETRVCYSHKSFAVDYIDERIKLGSWK